MPSPSPVVDSKAAGVRAFKFIHSRLHSSGADPVGDVWRGLDERTRRLWLIFGHEPASLAAIPWGKLEAGKRQKLAFTLSMIQDFFARAGAIQAKLKGLS